MNFVKLPSGRYLNLANVTMIVPGTHGADVYFNCEESGGDEVTMASQFLHKSDADALLRFIDLGCQNLTLAEATGEVHNG